MSDRPRVVVTGLGMVTSLGIGWRENWEAAIAGRSGAGPITCYDPVDTPTKIACEVTGFDPVDFMDRKVARRMDRFAHLAVAAGRLALEDAGLAISSTAAPRAGAVVGSGIGGLHTFVQQTLLAEERGADRVSPFFIPAVIANMAAAQVSMELGLQGPLSCVTTACASGNHALGDATDAIRAGRADVMLAGGTEASVTRVGIAAFNAMRALSTRNDDPEGASRPFDRARDGFVMGEAGAIVVLERLEHALERGAEPICEVLGYGLTGDAHHLTEPDPTGRAPAAAVAMALADAGVEPSQVDYVNAHATSTPVGDTSEIRALKLALGEDVARRVMVSSTKSMHGHCLGAAGGVEGALTALVLREGIIPPTINLEDLDPDCAGVDHVANEARRADVRVAVSSAFGFGGHNAIMVLGRVEDR
ncbi:beta-ketoacyl-ACP synthase II [Miltoncostaea marina]|uniref:beta-ketoacyl-ACP synthase II n=1 Tax=Miltoncostaea marina TaxID=2843215 RepID=UPI001C3D5B4F|nr:beta-ketoacyl-ACP synthase II [Miltoncostaea marina]